MMAGFHSFKETLVFWLGLNKPKRLLEWGPGVSTQLMLDHSEGKIQSIEHLYRWYEAAQHQFKDNPRVDLHYCPELDQYPYLPRDWGKFDLIFVDGLCDLRVKCLLASVDYLAEGGVVILHDSERSKYDAGREPYETVMEVDGTAVMKPKEDIKK